MTLLNDEKKPDEEIVKVDAAVPQPPIDELAAAKQKRERRAFEELTQRADAVDRVLMENGEPEDDLTSG